MTPLIITAAVNGSTKRARNPNVPLAPHEIVADALECMKAGAAIIHTHIEDYHMTGQVAADRYLESYRPIVQARPDAILCPSATIADTVELRWKYLEILAESGVMRMGTLDPGSLNIANSGENGLPGSYREVYCVPFPEIEYLLEALSDPVPIRIVDAKGAALLSAREQDRYHWPMIRTDSVPARYWGQGS